MSCPEAPAAAEPKAPESALLYITREDWEHSKDEFEELTEKFESLKIQLLPDGPLPWLARGLEGTEAVNLLQGEYARATDFGARWQKWRNAAMLAAALFTVHVAAEAVQIQRAKHAGAALDAQIAAVFSAAMPAETLQDPRRQMQSRLDRIRKSGAGPEHFLRALKVLSGALAGVPKTEIDALSYHEDSLDLKVMAPSLATVSQLSQLITKQGLSAEIQSSTPGASGIEAHLQLRSPSARGHR